MDTAELTEQLSTIQGVRGVVLGGSRARNLHSESSDYDLGLYYDGSIDVDSLRELATSVADPGEELTVVTSGEWGPWINGGAWLKIGGTKVDLLYREIDFVRRTAREARSGVFSSHYQVGHPSGYHSFHLLAECGAFSILADPTGVLGELKALANPYPEALRSAIVQKFLWEADFQLEIVERTDFGTDPAYEISAISRFVSCAIHVAFATSRIWFLNEKRALQTLIGLGADASALAEALAYVARLPDDALVEARRVFVDLQEFAESS